MTFDPVTFAFELVNFLVLAWLLTRYVLRPLATGIEARRVALAEVRAQADERLKLADGKHAELEARSRELDTLREQVLADAAARAASERAHILDEARQDAAAERARAGALVEAERTAALAWVRDEAVERATQVAGRLLLQLAPEAAHRALIERLAQAVVDRGEALRSPRPPEEVEITVPRVPDPSVETLRDTLGRALGRAPRLTVHEDSALGAGAVLRAGDHVLDASILGQLEVLRGEARRLLEADG
jgi:F-type H+-transporting ATPase subunit b